MKKIIIALVVFISAVAAGQAQNLISKVPFNASVVIKYSGDNFARNMPVTKLDSYSFIRKNLFKMLNIDSLSSFKNTGIDLEQDTYQYVILDDSSTNFVTLFNLQNTDQFLALLQANYHAEMRPEKKNGYQFLGISKDTYVGWNNKQAIMVATSYKNNNHYDFYSTDTSVTVTETMVEAPSADTTFLPPPPPPHDKYKKQVPGKKKPAAAGQHKKGATKRPVPKKKPVIVDEEVKPDETVEYKMTHEDSVAQEKREAWYAAQEKYTGTKQLQIADSIINASFNSSFTSIETEASYKKIIDPAAHAAVWLNYDNLLSKYWSYYFLGSGMHLRKPDLEGKKNINNEMNTGLRTGINIFFDKDKMRMDQKMYSPDDQISNMVKDIYSSRQSASLAGFVNPDNLAYLSMSVNTEAMAKYYYKLVRQYLGNTPYIGDYSDLVDVYLDLLEIIIDEKAIAELLPGNSMLVLHDMTTKEVTYIDYEYDEKEFKSKEVKKTRQELSPNFTFVMETKKEAFLQKLVNLPVKYAKKEKFDYQEKGGYYELKFEAGKYPLSSLYFMVKDGKGIVTTSKDVIDMTLKNTGYTLDADTKNAILNNSVSCKINSKKILQQIKPQLGADLSKKISQYFEDNIGDLKMEGGIINGMIQTTSTMGISGNHVNSFEFIFNMIESINDIMEKDKQEREKKVD